MSIFQTLRGLYREGLPQESLGQQGPRGDRGLQALHWPVAAGGLMPWMEQPKLGEHQEQGFPWGSPKGEVPSPTRLLSYSGPQTLRTQQDPPGWRGIDRHTQRCFRSGLPPDLENRQLNAVGQVLPPVEMREVLLWLPADLDSDPAPGSHFLCGPLRTSVFLLVK